MSVGGRILIIDDDPILLAGLVRQLGERFDISVAGSGEEAIQKVREESPFAAVLCDMRMPGMNGIETLGRIAEIAHDTVRMMLTGNADQQTAMDAINSGRVFKFFTKPCPISVLEEGFVQATHQYYVGLAEKDLLEKTLAGSVKVLVDLVAANNPLIARQARLMRDFTRRLMGLGVVPLRWQVDIASSLALIGQISLPVELLLRHRAGGALSDEEQAQIFRAPETARALIANLPRLSAVAEAVYLQDRGYDGSGFPADGPSGSEIPQDARILKIIKDVSEAAETIGAPDARAFAMLAPKMAQYDGEIFAKVRSCLEVPVEDGAPPPR